MWARSRLSGKVPLRHAIAASAARWSCGDDMRRFVACRCELGGATQPRQASFVVLRLLLTLSCGVTPGGVAAAQLRGPHRAQRHYNVVSHAAPCRAIFTRLSCMLWAAVQRRALSRSCAHGFAALMNPGPTNVPICCHVITECLQAAAGDSIVVPWHDGATAAAAAAAGHQPSSATSARRSVARGGCVAYGLVPLSQSGSLPMVPRARTTAWHARRMHLTWAATSTTRSHSRVLPLTWRRLSHTRDDPALGGRRLPHMGLISRWSSLASASISAAGGMSDFEQQALMPPCDLPAGAATWAQSPTLGLAVRHPPPHQRLACTTLDALAGTFLPALRPAAASMAGGR